MIVWFVLLLIDIQVAASLLLQMMCYTINNVWHFLIFSSFNSIDTKVTSMAYPFIEMTGQDLTVLSLSWILNIFTDFPFSG